ncbi:MAG: precorrin-3B C(17)-methyltransferase [Cyanobacteria bacterium J06648_16]
MSIAAITTTSAGLKCLASLGQSILFDTWIPEKLTEEATKLSLSPKTYTTSLKQQLPKIWQTHNSLLFCLTTGATTRLIAPLLIDKTTDPAIIVIDESAKFIISLCGGHQAGADQLTREIAHLLDAQPVLTGSANRQNLPGIDILGNPYGWTKGIGDWTAVSAAIAAQHPVQILQDCGSDLWQHHIPNPHPFQFGFPEFEDRNSVPKPQARVWISATQRSFSDEADLPKVQWHPRVLHVGIGCERGSAQALIEYAVEQAFEGSHLARGAIATLNTLDLKADEPGLLAFAEAHNLPLRCFTPEQLKDIPVPNPSDVVEQAVGTPSVAEAAAIVGATVVGESDELPELRVKKRVYRHPDYRGAVTVAIAQSEREYTGRTGQLSLVGTGPGSLDQITPAAKAAITHADVVIGYKLYVDLIRPLLRPGQIIEALPITQEKRRAERAIELAKWGLTVAVISSGDCGIYGMAGLVLETLKEQNWDGQTPTVQILPGISALQSAASRVGAPLMHDFCAISLSDLLTPWEVIQKRVAAAATADFVVALYNPKSKTRTEQIGFVQQTFLQHRSPATPVALARSLYRPDEQITLTTLAEMLNHPIDMLTTVLIGNNSSLIHASWFITPRGYLGFQ